MARPLPLVMLDLTLNVLVLQCVEATQPVLKRLRLSSSEPDMVSPHLAAVWVPLVPSAAAVEASADKLCTACTAGSTHRLSTRPSSQQTG